MKTITLNLFERVRLMNIVGAQEAANVQQQRELMRLLEAVELNDAEREEVGLQIDNLRGQVLWDPAKAEGKEYSITFTQNQANLLTAILSNDGGRYRVALHVRADGWAPRVLDELRPDA
jgi:hypothetical protein